MNFGKKDTECTTVGQNEDGSRNMVCKVGEGKIVQVTVARDGNISTKTEFVAVTPDEYRKIHKAVTDVI